jgi:two-component system, LytTR family, response regulator AlgR
VNGLRILIADDEPPARARLRALIDDAGIGSVIGEAGDGEQALAAVRELAPDIVLLDVRMPGMDGLQVAHHLAELPNPPAVVFTTAYDQHALAAFDAQAVDYLLKPVRAARLKRAVERAAMIAAGALDGTESARQAESRTHIGSGQRLVPIAEVRAMRAEHKYVSAIVPNGEVVLEDTLGALEEEFAARFMRVHRSTLVAVPYIRELQRDDGGHWTLTLDSVELRVEVSRRLVASVKARLGR